MQAEYVEVINVAKTQLTQQEVNYHIVNRDITYALDLWGAYNRVGLIMLGMLALLWGLKGY